MLLAQSDSYVRSREAFSDLTSGTTGGSTVHARIYMSDIYVVGNDAYHFDHWSEP
jgi:hypothetical protein